MHFRTANLASVQYEGKTRRPTNCRGNTKRDVAHPTATVVYNTCYHLFRKRSCITDDRDNNTRPIVILTLEYDHCTEN